MPDRPSLQLDEDTRLMVQASDGDRSAYEKVYGRYFPIIVSFLSGRRCRRQACEDLAQEVFARVWRQRSRYKPLAPVKSYLLGVAVNVLREHHVQTRRGVCSPSHAIEALADESVSSPPSQAQSAEQLQAVRTLMTNLPTRQRQAAELVYVAGLPPAEAARRMGCSVKTLNAHLYQARKKLRELVLRSTPPRPTHKREAFHNSLFIVCLEFSL
jgi:RNA polymerase sigma-70 factor (ECF subfamily)